MVTKVGALGKPVAPVAKSEEEEAREMACHLKAHVSEVGQQVSKTSIEVHGGMGFTDEMGLHYWFKRIGLNRQLLGSPELMLPPLGGASRKKYYIFLLSLFPGHFLHRFSSGIIDSWSS